MSLATVPSHVLAHILSLLVCDMNDTHVNALQVLANAERVCRAWRIALVGSNDGAAHSAHAPRALAPCWSTLFDRVVGGQRLHRREMPDLVVYTGWQMPLPNVILVPVRTTLTAAHKAALRVYVSAYTQFVLPVLRFSVPTLHDTESTVAVVNPYTGVVAHISHWRLMMARNHEERAYPERRVYARKVRRRLFT